MAGYETEYPMPVAPQPAPRAGLMLIIDLVLVFIGFLVLSIVIPGVFIAIRASQQGIQLGSLGTMQQSELLRLIGVDGVFVLLLAQNLLFIGIPFIRVAFFQRAPLATIGFQAPQLPRLVLFGIGLGFLTLLSNGLLGALFTSLGIRQNQSAQYPLFAGDYLGQALFAIGAALLAPIGEEVLMRGYVFNTLRRIWSNTSWGLIGAYLLSALLFSFAHSLAATQGVIGLLVPAFCMGLLLAWGMHRTGSLIPPIIAHCVNNGVALIALITCLNNPGMCPNV